jgi:hypothetical protein
VCPGRHVSRGLTLGRWTWEGKSCYFNSLKVRGSLLFTEQSCVLFWMKFGRYRCNVDIFKWCTTCSLPGDVTSSLLGLARTVRMFERRSNTTKVILDRKIGNGSNPFSTAFLWLFPVNLSVFMAAFIAMLELMLLKKVNVRGKGCQMSYYQYICTWEGCATWLADSGLLPLGFF